MSSSTSDFENDRDLRFALRASGIGTWTIDLSDFKIHFSEEARELMGTDLTHQNVFEFVRQFVHQEDRQSVEDRLRDSVKNRRRYADVYRVIHPSRGERWIDSQGAIRFAPDGRARLAAGIIMDVTERKQREIALKKTEQNFRSLFESAPGLYLVVDTDHMIVAVSDAYNTATMTKRDEIIGRYLFDVFPDNPNEPGATGVANLRNSLNTVIQTKLPHTMALQKYDVRGPDGNFEEKWWSPVNSPVIGSDGKVAYVIHRAENVTAYVLEHKAKDRELLPPTGAARIEAELFQRVHEFQDANSNLRGALDALTNSQEELKSAKDDADRANRAKSSFLANMSHEIRTPLGAIMGFANLARERGVTKEELAEYLAVVERNSAQVLRIIDDVLDLAKVEAGKIEIELTEVFFFAFLAELSSVMSLRAKEKGITFELVADSSLPDRICTDTTRLRQILTNAVGNAIKFTSRGSVQLRVSYREGLMEFRVVDTGRGISVDQSSRLFQAFVQADASTTRQYGGTGLGLVLTKRLCQLLGGDYALVESELSSGSVFAATIRPKLAPTAQLIKREQIQFTFTAPSARPAVLTRLAGARVLLVEDSPDNQVLIRLLLEKQGAIVSLAVNGLDGVAKALSETFDVILMDIQMPKMDGHEATRALRARHYNKPIVALTAHAMKEEAARARDSGFTTFLTKPVQRDLLVETVRSLMPSFEPAALI